MSIATPGVNVMVVDVGVSPAYAAATYLNDAFGMPEGVAAIITECESSGNLKGDAVEYVTLVTGVTLRVALGRISVSLCAVLIVSSSESTVNPVSPIAKPYTLIGAAVSSMAITRMMLSTFLVMRIFNILLTIVLTMKTAQIYHLHYYTY